MSSRTPIALLSVFNKTGIVDFAKSLAGLGYQIVSSGGTAKELIAAGLSVTDVAEITGMGAILNHKVVTLHPKVHGGILVDPNDEKEMAEALAHGIKVFDLVCVDLYPLKEEIAKDGATRESVRAKTDIGGPTMIRAAAKGRRITVCDPADRQLVIDWLKAGKPEEEKFINRLVARAEFIIADYCFSSAAYHGDGDYAGFHGTRVLACKYGENAHQTPAALYSCGTDDPLALDKFEVVAGSAPSYNNLCDLDRMLQTATHIDAALQSMTSLPPAAIALAVKHGNCCGAAFGKHGSYEEVLKKMICGDTRAIFGGLVFTNFEVGFTEADILLCYLMDSGRRVLDGIVAPSFTKEAIELLKRKGDKCRFIANPALRESRLKLDTADRFRYVRGGFLKQPNYRYNLVANLNLDEVDRPELPESAGTDMLLAWAIGSTSNSNTITLVKSGTLIGNAVGQQDRVGAAELAVKRAKDAGHDTKGSVAYSDSFFPFPDALYVLSLAGVKAILTSSGSINDKKTREFCEHAGIVLAMVPDADARGFYGH